MDNCYLKHITLTNAWGPIGKVNGFLILLTDVIVGEMGCPYVVHCAYQASGHSAKSQHYLGNAQDGHFVTDISFREQVHRVMTILDGLNVSDRVGVGIYPDWKILATGEPCPGFHIDVRGTKARWGRINDEYVGWLQALKYIEKKGL